MMTLAIVLTAIFSAIALQTQGRRHFFEKKLEYERLGRQMPLPAPKIPMLEAVLTGVLGFLLFAVGSASTAKLFTLPEAVHDRSAVVSASVMLAAGVALLVLGGRAVRQNRAFENRANVEPSI